MAIVSVNDESIVNGRFTIQRELNENNEIVITGVFATHFYFEEITKLDSLRYTVNEVEVIKETFASDDYEIIYTFKAKEIINKHGLSDLTKEEITAKAKESYDDRGYFIDSNLAGMSKITSEVTEEKEDE